MFRTLYGSSPILSAITTNLAVAGPTLLYAGAHPLVSFSTDLLALLGWSLWAVHIAHRTALDGRPNDIDTGLWSALLLLLGLLMAAALAIVGFGTPWRLAMRQGSAVAVAVVVLLCAARLMHRNASDAWPHESLVRVLFVALLLAGAANGLIAWLQFFAPANVPVSLPLDGRATGHLRQPNLLASLVLMALVAAVACRQVVCWPLWLFIALYGLLAFALALSLSRMGAMTCLLLAAWGLLDRHLQRSSRVVLLVLPIVLAVCWWTVVALQQAWGMGGQALDDRISTASSRWALWRDALHLIGLNPWVGVGWGQFNFAWTLVPSLQARSQNEMFTHAHNLLLQWAVEFGLPATLVLVGLALWALWRAFRLARAAQGNERTWRTAALMVVLVVLAHSQLEFPLWQAGFLLTTACMAGVALGPASGNASAPLPAQRVVRGRGRRRAAAASGLLLAAASGVAWDYQHVRQLYTPADSSLSDDARVQVARRSLLFRQFGDRYAGTLAGRGHRRLAPYCEIVFEQLDTQLLYSWTLAQAEAGATQKARYLAARLREFDRPLTKGFFEVCQGPAALQAFQCQPSDTALQLRDLRPTAEECNSIER